MGDVDRMEHVGGHAAVDFVNTLGGLPDVPDDEYLFSYADLVTFVVDSELLTSPTAERLRRNAERRPHRAAEALNRALQLRTALDHVLRANLATQPPDDTDLAVIRHEHLAALGHAALTPVAGRYRWTLPSSGDTLDLPLWSLALQTVELLRFAPLHRLGRCGHCRWLFLDTSKNYSRRWCSMNTCGSIMKMRRYRATRRR